jgi:hypothetical protein
MRDAFDAAPGPNETSAHGHWRLLDAFSAGVNRDLHAPYRQPLLLAS